MRAGSAMQSINKVVLSPWFTTAPWTVWNTVRTIAGIGAAGLLTVGLTVD